VELKVDMTLPDASEVEKLEDKALVDYIYIGPPTDEAKYGTEPRIQLDDQYATLEEIIPWKTEKVEARDEAEQPLVTTSMKVDKDTYMKIVTDVKQELRQGNFLKINYSTARGR
jgi:anthranilate/para-aminobenzoate synthase component I